MIEPSAATSRLVSVGPVRALAACITTAPTAAMIVASSSQRTIGQAVPRVPAARSPGLVADGRNARTPYHCREHHRQQPRALPALISAPSADPRRRVQPLRARGLGGPPPVSVGAAISADGIRSRRSRGSGDQRLEIGAQVGDQLALGAVRG